MSGLRQQKVARAIQRDMGEILQQQGPMLVPGRMITVTQVRMSPDLGLAKVYISIFPSSKAKQDLERIKDAGSSLRFELGKRVKNQLRVVPELAFYLDDSLDYAERIDELLN